jgi:hypothetical protein
LSNYTPVTSFVSKDTLISGNPLKSVKGAELTTEFTAVQTALNSKIDGTVQFFPDGTAGQPSVGFTNNNGTGMYNAAGALNFATSGLQRISISAAGNVVHNAPTSGAAFALSYLAGGTAMTFNDGAGVTGAYTSSGGIINFGATSANALQLTSSVGIFTTGATGGAQGSGTFNATSLYMNGVAVGYLGVPVNLQTVNYTPVASDAGKSIGNYTGSTLTFTIPSNASVPYPIGTVLTFETGGSGTVTNIAINSDTLTQYVTGLTGTRSLAQNSIATAHKVNATSWYIGGGGLT